MRRKAEDGGEVDDDGDDGDERSTTTSKRRKKKHRARSESKTAVPHPSGAQVEKPTTTMAEESEVTKRALPIRRPSTTEEG